MSGDRPSDWVAFPPDRGVCDGVEVLLGVAGRDGMFNSIPWLGVVD